MGMTCDLRRVSEAEIGRLLANPEEVITFLLGPAEEPPAPGGGVLGFLKRLSPIKIETTVPPDPDELRDDEIDIDKAWHGLHFLFTGTAWEGELPASFLLRGGEELGGDEEIGQGPPLAYRPEKVREIAAFLNGLSKSELEQRFDPAKMTKLEIYPETIWTRDKNSSEYLLASFDSLKDFVNTAMRNGEGLIVYLT
jgi:hypothetical protein